MTYRKISHVNNELFKNGNDLNTFDEAPTRHKKHIAWRRQKAFQLLVQGVTSTYDIASVLKVSQSTASRDIRYWKDTSVEELKTHVRERLPFEYRICSQGLQQVLHFAWSMILDENTRANKIAALTLIAQLYKDRLEIATNASVVTSALQEVKRMKNQILASNNLKIRSDNRS